MSSDRSVPVVDLTLGASRTLSLSVTAVTLLAGVAVFASGLPVWLKCLIVAVILVSAIRWLLVEGLRCTPHSVVRLVLMDEEECMVVERSGAQSGVRTVQATVICSSLTVVILRSGRWQARALCIAGDAVDGDGFRRLRMRLCVSPPGMKQTIVRKRLLNFNSLIKRKTDA
ncbi:MAG: protein YgfX [Gammaproteobacteria bacterium]